MVIEYLSLIKYVTFLLDDSYNKILYGDYQMTNKERNLINSFISNYKICKWDLESIIVLFKNITLNGLIKFIFGYN